MEKTIKVKISACDFPGCNHNLLNLGTILQFGKCKHDCCPEHVIRTYHGEAKILRDSCGVCAELKEKVLKKEKRKLK